jgi:ribosomal subunit interface protein
MRITTIHATGIQLTDAIREYVTEKVESLARFTKRFDPCDVAVELGKTTGHHQKGDIFFAEFCVSIPGDMIRVRNEMDDLYAAIDESKDDLKRECVERKEKMMERRGDDDRSK